MSYFQHKKTVDLTFYYYIICITTCTHIAVIIGLFFLYRGTDQHFNIVIGRSMPTNFNIRLYTTQQENSIKNPRSTLTSIQKNVTLQKKNTSKNTSKIIQKPIEKKTIMTSPKPTPKTLATTKKVVPPIKKTVKTSLKNNTKIIKKEVDLVKKAALEQQKPDTKKSNPTEPFNTPLEKTDNTIQNNQSPELSLDELAFLKKLDELQQELTSVWHPPIVQKANPSCTVELYISWEGIIENIAIKETSGILIFDTAARKAVLDMRIPLWAKGKSITITLKA